MEVLQHLNFMVYIRINHLDKKLTDFNFTEVQFSDQCHDDVYCIAGKFGKLTIQASESLAN